MDQSGTFLWELFLIFTGGKLLAEVFERLRQPAVMGELIAGVLLGPSVFGLIHPGEMTAGLAEMGAIFLLFSVGLESKPHDLMKVGLTAASTAALASCFFPLVICLYDLDRNLHAGIHFRRAAMVATSVGITARVLSDAGVLSKRFAHVILAAAVLDDILGMIVLAVVSSLASGAINYPSLIAVTLEAVGLTVLILLFGPRVARRLGYTVARLSVRNSAFVLSIIMCLGLSFASHYVGMAAIIGAFLAGLALADQSEQWRLRESIGPVSDFLTPFFFVLIGAQVNLRTLFQPGLLSILVAICFIAFVSKLMGCGLASLPLGWRNALRVGIGMIPRGEVGLIVAAVGLRLHTISEAVYLVVVGMSLVTTLLTPPILRLLLPRPAPEDGR